MLWKNILTTRCLLRRLDVKKEHQDRPSTATNKMFIANIYFLNNFVAKAAPSRKKVEE